LPSVNVDASCPARFIVAAAEAGRVVDENIDPAQKLCGRTYIGPNCISIREIALHRVGLDAMRTDFGGRRVERGLTTSAYRNSRSGTRETKSN